MVIDEPSKFTGDGILKFITGWEKQYNSFSRGGGQENGRTDKYPSPRRIWMVIFVFLSSAIDLVSPLLLVQKYLLSKRARTMSF
tara:strand:- start:792 stop:1043 length:252 start_codon:yes stop_codon:yes gene_type:complete